MALTDLLIGECWLHIELNAKHRPPGGEMLEQGLGARRLADHDTTTCLGAMRAADQLKAFKTISLCTIGHVLDQYCASGLLTFNFRELPRDIIELHVWENVDVAF